MPTYYTTDSVPFAPAVKVKPIGRFWCTHWQTWMVRGRVTSRVDWPGEVRAGHDFWLTRCGHGVGFWDRGLGDLGDRLTASAKVYGNVDLYPGDDGWIYC